MPWNTCLVPSVAAIQLRPPDAVILTVTPSGTSATAESVGAGASLVAGGVTDTDTDGVGDGARIGVAQLGRSRFQQVYNLADAFEQIERLEPGQRVLCLGVGSGLNTTLMEIAW